MTRSEAKVGIVGCIVFALAYPSAVASSLLIAPLMAFTALIMLPLWPHSWREVSWPWASIPLALFLVWVGISFLWSPHDDPQQIHKKRHVGNDVVNVVFTEHCRGEFM